MNVLIVDDEPLAREDLHYLISDSQMVDQIDEADSIENALIKLTASTYDLIFLDIQLGESSGFTLAQHLKTLKSPVQIIFSTAYEQYALDAFNIDAVDYILKPLDQKRVNESLEKAKRRLKVLNAESETKDSKYPSKITITDDGKTYLVDTDEIIYIETDIGKLHIKTKTNDYYSKKTLSKIKELLDPTTFIQIHRSYIINLNYIDTVEPGFNHNYIITLSNKTKVTVSRSFVKDVKNKLNL